MTAPDVCGDRVTAPLFHISLGPVINLSAVRERRFSDSGVCAACGTHQPRLSSHIRNSTDDDHVVLQIHDS